MKLEVVSGFGSFPDGRLRAGPFILSVDLLSNLMRRMRIFPGEDILDGKISSVPGGIMMSAAGAGVTGYFVDQEGLEVTSTDLDRFVIRSTASGSPFRVQGHYCPDQGVMISSEAVAVHDGRHVTWHRMRRLHSADGTERVINATRPGIAPMRAVAV